MSNALFIFGVYLKEVTLILLIPAVIAALIFHTHRIQNSLMNAKKWQHVLAYIVIFLILLYLNLTFVF